MYKSTTKPAMNTPIDLRKAVHNLNSLPALPVIAQKLLALKLDSEEGEKQMMLLIAQDPMVELNATVFYLAGDHERRSTSGRRIRASFIESL